MYHPSIVAIVNSFEGKNFFVYKVLFLRNKRNEIPVSKTDDCNCSKKKKEFTRFKFNKSVHKDRGDKKKKKKNRDGRFAGSSAAPTIAQKAQR